MLARLISPIAMTARCPFAKSASRCCSASAVCFVLVMREPDFGTASMFVITAAVMLFVAARWHTFSFGLVAAVPTLLLFVYSSAYRRDRFTAFLHPWNDPQGTGYHIIQSLYALGSGGMASDLGLGQSRQKFGYLPEQHTDFIYSIIGEELGFVGAAAVVILFLAFAYCGVRIAMRAEDRFGFYLAIGLTASITLQALMNIGVVTSSWPVTGVPLPFISYGGTSLVVTLFGVGLLASISRGRRKPASSLPVTRRKAS